MKKFQLLPLPFTLAIKMHTFFSKTLFPFKIHPLMFILPSSTQGSSQAKREG
jgi:hypothetical protein